jgi:hypothetical protein
MPQPMDEGGLRLNTGPNVEWTAEPLHEPGLDTLPLRGEYPPPEESPVARQTAAWITIAAIAAASAFAGYHYWSTRNAAAPPVALPTAPAAATPAGPAAGAATATTRLGGDVAPLDVPPLDLSDTAVGALVKALSSHPRVTAWLATKGLIRNFTVVVENIAAGKTPAMHLQALSLSSPFQTSGGQDRPVIDSRTYKRYDGLAAAVASIDPAAAARLYGGLRPRLDEAYRDLGHEMPFDAALERAIVLLLDTPIPEGPVRLMRPTKGVAYTYADPRLEGLTAAQKQLVRMGPDNARKIQGSLRAIALALGVPAARLP